MQKCQACSNPFTWKSIEKSLFLGYKPLICTRCHRVHDIRFMTRMALVMLTTTLPLVVFFSRVNTLGSACFLTAYLAWCTVIMATTPFFARYQVREVPEESAAPK